MSAHASGLLKGRSTYHDQLLKCCAHPRRILIFDAEAKARAQKHLKAHHSGRLTWHACLDMQCHALGPNIADEQAALSLSGKQHAPSSCYTLAHLRQQALNEPPGLEALRVVRGDQPEVVPQREEGADVED